MPMFHTNLPTLLQSQEYKILLFLFFLGGGGMFRKDPKSQLNSKLDLNIMESHL